MKNVTTLVSTYIGYNFIIRFRDTFVFKHSDYDMYFSEDKLYTLVYSPSLHTMYIISELNMGKSIDNSLKNTIRIYQEELDSLMFHIDVVLPCYNISGLIEKKLSVSVSFTESNIINRRGLYGL